MTTAAGSLPPPDPRGGPSSAPLLEVTGLRTWFDGASGAARAVDGVDLQVHAGEMVGMVGESGCGKTVTALSVMGLVPAPPGRILPGSSVRLEGRELVGMPPRELRRLRGGAMAMVFQEPMTALNPVLTVGSQIAEAIRLHRGLGRRAAWREAVDLLAEVGIPDPTRRAREHPYRLSGGMRQRVGIAIALACEPSLLIADEPTTALDVTIQAQILELLSRLRDERGMGILLISHDLAVVAEVSDRAVVIYAGRVVEAARADRIFGAPRHPYTRALLASLPGRSARRGPLPVIPGVVPAPTDLPGGCAFEPRCPEALERCRKEAPALLSVTDSDEIGGSASRCWLEDGSVADRPRGGGGGSPNPPRPGGHAAGSQGEIPQGLSRPGGEEAPERGAKQGEVLLEVEGLRKHFPLRRSFPGGRREMVRAVDGISLEILRGETLALVGESGCGKSTAARSLLRIVEPTSGRIRFDGTDVSSLRGRGLRAFRRRAQMVFQDPFSSLNPRLRVNEAIEEVLRVQGLAGGGAGRRRRTAELLERVGLHPDHARRYPHQFSGGQRQRIGIARALAVEPDFLVLDEPVTSLDVSVQAQVVNLLLELQRDLGLTYLLIAHDLSLVEHMSDRVAVMYLGRIVETGPTETVRSSPLHPYTRALLSAVPMRDPERAGGDMRTLLLGEVPSPVDSPEGCPFHPRCWHPEKDEECASVVPALESWGEGREAACIRIRDGYVDGT